MSSIDTIESNLFYSNTAEACHRFRKCRNKAVSAVRSARSDYFSSLQPLTDRSKKFWNSYHNLFSYTAKVPVTVSNQFLPQVTKLPCSMTILPLVFQSMIQSVQIMLMLPVI